MASVPSATAQATAIRRFQSDPLIHTAGQRVNIVAARWLQAWRAFVGWDAGTAPAGSAPGPIDNEAIVPETNAVVDGVTLLRKGVQEEKDFVVVLKEQWDLLVQWYGGGPAVARTVISTGVSGQVQVEIQPYSMTVRKIDDKEGGPTSVLLASKVSTLGELAERASKRMGATGKWRLWRLDPSHRGLRFVLLDVAGRARDTLEEAELTDGHQIAVEVPRADGRWYRADDSAEPAAAAVPLLGRVGLRNLGNTCFMNSALQCLSNTPAFTEYFLTGQYLPHVNHVNPLGTKGALVTAYASWLAEMWRGGELFVSPVRLRTTIGKFAPQFAGFQQQDSHELLVYLLDGLHEDTNTVLDKPSVNDPEGDGVRPNAEVAVEAWEGHRSRNRSRVVDLLQGQLKSTLVCPTCQRTSVKFDPCFGLSVPVPGPPPSKKGQRLTLLRQNGAEPARHTVPVSSTACIGELKRALGVEADDVGLASDLLAIVEVADHHVCTVFENEDPAYRILPDETILAFETHSQSCGAGIIPAVHRRETFKSCLYCGKQEAANRCGACKKAMYCSRDCQVKHWAAHKPKCGSEASMTGYSRFGLPFVLSSPSDVFSARDVMNAVFAHVSSMVTVPLDAGALPFTVHLTHRKGLRCLRCPVEAGCTGCPLPADDMTPIVFNEYEGIALSWTAAGYAIYDLDKAKAIMSPVAGPVHKPVRLVDCLARFSETEVLTKGNEWYCNKCQAHQLATKSLEPWRLPEYLVLHLKRFQRRSLSGVFGEKINTPVIFEKHLDMRPYISAEAQVGLSDNDLQYELYAVSSHIGNMYAGHYTAYALNQGTWLQYDDRDVRPVEEGQALADTTTAYVLFYKRRR